MSNVYTLPSLELGFKARLEELEHITKSGLAIFPNGGAWGLTNLWVAGDTIVDRHSRGAYPLTQHIQWLREHVVNAATDRAPAKRKVFTPISLPPKGGDKQERLDAVNTLIVGGKIRFMQGLVSFNACRVVGDQIVVDWESGTGYRIETELEWLRRGIGFEERRANRPAFQPKPAKSIHQNRHLTEQEKAEAKRKQAERKTRVRAASMEDLAIRSRLPRPGAQAGNSVKGKKGKAENKKGRRAA